jgi:hypothetical protein
MNGVSDLAIEEKFSSGYSRKLWFSDESKVSPFGIVVGCLVTLNLYFQKPVDGRAKGKSDAAKECRSSRRGSGRDAFNLERHSRQRPSQEPSVEL